MTRTRALDEDAKEDMANDDKDEQDDAYVAELDEYHNAPLTFQERSLREYFRAVSVEAHGKEELRTPSSAAHLTILTMSIEVLMKLAKEGHQAQPSKLGDYAVKYWHDHFNELDPTTLSDEEFNEALTSVYKITSNENNVAKKIELLASQPAYIYPENSSDEAIPWYTRLESWAKKGESLPPQILNSEIREWLGSIVINPKSVLESLARGHIANWLSELEAGQLLDAYTYAEVALRLVSPSFHNRKY